MTQRYLRKYKITVGSPLTFYEGTVNSTIIPTPPERLAARAVRNEQFAAPFRSIIPNTQLTPQQKAILGWTNKGKIIGSDPNNNLLDPERRAYEAFIADQQALVEAINLDQAEGGVIEDLHITFNITKGGDEAFNTITLYNISNKTAGLLVQRSTKFNPIITLEAGYQNDDELALVFKGEVEHVKDVWEGSTRVTTLSVKAAPTSKKEAYTVRSYPKGTAVESIVKDVIKDMKLSEGVIFVPEKGGREIKVDKAKYIQCQSWEGLISLCADNGLKAVVEDGKVNVTPQAITNSKNTVDQVENFLNGGLRNNYSDLKATEVEALVAQADAIKNGLPSPIRAVNFLTGSIIRPAREGVTSLLNPAPKPFTPFNDGLVAETTVKRFGVKFDRTTAKVYDTSLGGIIGSPIAEVGTTDGLQRQPNRPDKLKIKVFLDATIKLEDIIQVKSNSVDGIYRVVQILHTGQYEGSDWYSELTLEALDSWVVDTNVPEANIRALKVLQDKYKK